MTQDEAFAVLKQVVEDGDWVETIRQQPKVKYASSLVLPNYPGQPGVMVGFFDADVGGVFVKSDFAFCHQEYSILNAAAFAEKVKLRAEMAAVELVTMLRSNIHVPISPPKEMTAMTPERAMELAKLVSFDERIFAAKLIDAAHVAIRDAILLAVTETITPPAAPPQERPETCNVCGETVVNLRCRCGVRGATGGPGVAGCCGFQERPSDPQTEMGKAWKYAADSAQWLAEFKRLINVPGVKEILKQHNIKVSVGSADRQAIEQAKTTDIWFGFAEVGQVPDVMVPADPQPNLVVGDQ